jgi:hypothetical protein
MATSSPGHNGHCSLFDLAHAGAAPEVIKTPSLSAADHKHLDLLNRKLQMVRDYTVSVATGRTTGAYIFGNGGCGKSFNIINELDRLQIPYKLFNSRMTGRGMFNALEAYPDAIHLFEDMEQMFRDSGARGVLRSALWTQPSTREGPSQRLVTWTTYRMEHSFVFSGGIIMTGNRPFPPLPELEAIKTRIGYMHLAVSDNELMALMRHVSLQGFQSGLDVMDAGECGEVCEFIITQCRGLNRSLDMRMLINGFKDYLQWRECMSGCDWHDLVATRVKERPIGLEQAKTFKDRASQKERELTIAKEIADMTEVREERRKLWVEKTGKSEQTLYRRLSELKASSTK